MSASSDAGISGLPNAFSLTNFQTVAAREAAATLSALRMTDPIGPIRAAIAGRYEIEREIGQGAFATVYLARDLRHDRLVAFKVLTANLDSEDSELRFLREIRLLARLQHPNILPLIDSGHAEALLYYVMPYVKGESLRERIHRERQLAIDAAIGIAREAADALACAHEQGIVHRDI
jgi:serine/threonine protein kinase